MGSEMCIRDRVIAEGIETEHQLQMIKALGIEYGQGYFFGKPMSAEDAARLLEKESQRVGGTT